MAAFSRLDLGPNLRTGLGPEYFSSLLGGEMPTPLQVATAFVESINSQDLSGVIHSVSDDSRFFVDGEPPTVGRESLRDAWAGYFEAFPAYLIFVDESYERPDAVYLVGHTRGSHVPSELEKIPSSVIWRCEVTDDLVAEWSVFPASEGNRRRFDLPEPAV